jgi:hypothetical protein
MFRQSVPLILMMVVLAGCVAPGLTDVPIDATLVLTESTEPAPTASATLSIDPNPTSIAETLHPPLTGTSTALDPDLAITAGVITPMPTSMQPAVEPLFIYEASEEIRVASWSPDGRWVSFWIPPPNVDGFTIDEMPIFVNVETGQTCTYEEFIGAMQYEFPDTYSYWQDDGYATLLVNGTPYAGLPCEEFVRAPDSFGIPPHNIATSFSPDGVYQLETVYNPQEVHPPAAISTITSTVTGQVLNTVHWRSITGQYQGWPGGYWIGSSHFLLNRTYDEGALLITVGEEHVIDVLPELFFVHSVPNPNMISVNGSVQQRTESYHVLLSLGNEQGSPETLMLYHSESGYVETLPFRHYTSMNGNGVYYAGFSPDGEWLLLQMPLTDPEDNYSDTWLLPVENRDQEAIYIGRIGVMHWSDATQHIAYAVEPYGGSKGEVIIATFPEMQIIARVTSEYRYLRPRSWSSDGTRLLMIGSNAGGGDESLFWIEP